MLCVIFCDSQAAKTVDYYNKWAKDKPLAKDVIIHSHVVPPTMEKDATLAILVFFDEKIHPEWQGVAEKPRVAVGIPVM